MIKRLILTAFSFKAAKALYEVAYKLSLDYAVKNGTANQKDIVSWNEYVDEQARRKHWHADRLLNMKVDTND